MSTDYGADNVCPIHENGFLQTLLHLQNTCLINRLRSSRPGGYNNNRKCTCVLHQILIKV